MKRIAVAVAAVAASAAPALAAPARSAMTTRTFFEPGAVKVADPATMTRIVYLNDCKPNGCQVHQGRTSSLTNTSSVAKNGVLTGWTYDDATWSSVVSCVTDVMSPFNLQVTTTDPGASTPHFEIMIAGTGADVGEADNILGVSPYACTPDGNNNPAGQFVDNTLVFVFANMSYYATGGTTADVDMVCATAAQEIAHSFALDHTTDVTDPMSYFLGPGRRYYKNGRVCGSDCVNGVSPLGDTCTGTGGQEHPCACGNGAMNQDDVSVITALFGAQALIVPTVTMVAPKAGATVHPGSHIEGTITANAPIVSGVMLLDGTVIDTSDAGPYAYNLPANTTTGSHTLELDGTDQHGTVGKATVTFNVTPAAALGDTCTTNGDCATGKCASDSGDERCVQSCDMTSNPCPSGFDCLAAGTGGVCWPSSGDGGGGGGCDGGGGSAPVLPIGLGLGFAALVFARRRA